MGGVDFGRPPCKLAPPLSIISEVVWIGEEEEGEDGNDEKLNMLPTVVVVKVDGEF